MAAAAEQEKSPRPRRTHSAGEGGRGGWGLPGLPQAGAPALLDVVFPESQGWALPGPTAGQAKLLVPEPSLPADRQSHRPGQARLCLLGEGG